MQSHLRPSLKLLAAAFLVLSALSVGASGQSLDAIPRRPIPYRVLTHDPVKPKHKPKPAVVATAPGAQTKASAAATMAPPPPSPALPAPAVQHPASLKPAPPAPPVAPPPGQQRQPPLLALRPAASTGVAAPVQASPPAKSAPPPALALPPAAPPPLHGQPIAAADLQAFVDAQVERAMAADHVAGAVVAVVQNGQLVMEKGYGLSSLTPARRMDPRATLVRLGSASQTFTWIAALKAVADGKLDLNKAVNAYLPDDLKLPEEGFKQPVLVSQLMSRTAGFEDRRFGRRYVRETDRITSLDEALQRQRPRRMRAAGLVSVPSDYGAALAGEVVARVENKPFDQMIETEILRPLGLNHTSFREPYPAAQGLPDPLSERLSSAMGTEFHWTGHGVEAEPFAYGESLAPAIAASSTADDMARLMIALLNNGVLGQSSLYDARTAALFAQPLQASVQGAPGSAHGLLERNLPGAGRALFERGAGAESQAQLLLVPGMNLGIFVAANTDSGAPLVASLPAAVAEHFSNAPVAPAWPAMAGWSPAAYLSADRASHGLEAFVDRLTKVSRLGSDSDGGFVLQDRTGERRFAGGAMENLYTSADGRTLYFPKANSGRPPIYVLGSGEGGGERVGGTHRISVLIVTATLVLIAIFTNLASLFIRDHVDQRQTNQQITGAITQGIACLAWSVAFVCFGLFLKGGADPHRLLFDWPDHWLVTASWSGLIAALLSMLMLVQIPGVWREERRIHGWSMARKFRHTATIFVFLAFSIVLASWGALEPWSS